MRDIDGTRAGTCSEAAVPSLQERKKVDKAVLEDVAPPPTAAKEKDKIHEEYMGRDSSISNPLAIDDLAAAKYRSRTPPPSSRGKMAFDTLLGASPALPATDSSSSITSTPPHTRVVPPHARSNSQRRNLTTPSHSPVRSQASDSPQVTSTRRQTTGASNTPSGQLPHHNVAFRRPSTQSSHHTMAFQTPRPRNGNMAHSRPSIQPRSHPINHLELRVNAQRLPPNWTTLDIYRSFERFGNIARIELHERTNERAATVIFRPSPANISWVGRPVRGTDSTGSAKIIETSNLAVPIYTYPSRIGKRNLPQRMSVPLMDVKVGVMRTASEMTAFFNTQSTPTTSARLMMDLDRKALLLTFSIEAEFEQPTLHTIKRHFKVKISPAQVRQAQIGKTQDNRASLVLSIDSPPLVFRKLLSHLGTHDPKETFWNEDSKMWMRQTDICRDPLSKKTAVQLQKRDATIDIGRWSTYYITFDQSIVHTQEFLDICQALQDHNIIIHHDSTIDVDDTREPGQLWSWLNAPGHSKTASGSYEDELREVAEDVAHLPFSVRYQLEVCLSTGVIHEVNMTRDFMKKLGAMETQRAIKVLEKVADGKHRYYNPDDIFKLQNQVSIVPRKRPGYCTKIPSAIVTPTTIYFATPCLETSNRVVRHYQQHEDRFLRVKFKDELHKGKIWSQDDRSEDEVFSRIHNALTYGIKIGDRLYEFLAFGSSQFREHGAYFFASTATTTAEDIRRWMGNFTHINVVAKYCARLGQCFSTTRAIPHKINIEKLPDIERNGHCFTDGAGKISPLLAQIIAHHYGMTTVNDDYPSGFQFRLAGCKGILSVDPSLRGLTIQIRPSQQKFAAQSYGLEVCRISQYSAAYLNMQLILVLSALGVPDSVFIGKVDNMISDIQQAMTNEKKALELLQKNIDYNQMTLTLASMIYDGFMETRDPFLITCMRLWRSWSLKYLKERARILVEEGFFGLGSPDETGILRGHFDTASKDELPEIFLQLPDPDTPGKYKVVLGVCALARNPSLHPGDVRVVCAVDVPALHHKKNEIILPITGDRPLANMCSGGDLDGDDFIVIWDEGMIPTEQNHEPMDYTAPAPVVSEGPVTVADMIKFFINYIKNDNLAKLATAHRYWADSSVDSVKNPKCIALANLNSMSVDYNKTGVPAHMPADLKVKRWPHWSEPKVSKSKIYQSKKILGQLYDKVNREPFEAAWDLTFDDRILNACEPTVRMLKDARMVKDIYDESVRRIMVQHGIKTEFEVCTTFVLEHHQDINDYRFAETMGEVAHSLRQQHQELCYDKAGTDAQNRDLQKLKPFLVAMYRVTRDEVAAAFEETKQIEVRAGRPIAIRARTFEAMPLMSFPWIFARELGQIATKGVRSDNFVATPRPTLPAKMNAKKQQTSLLGDEFMMPPLEEITVDGNTVPEGGVLDMFDNENEGESSDMTIRPLDPATREKSFDSTSDSMAGDTGSELARSETPGTEDGARDEVDTVVGDHVAARKDAYDYHTSDAVALVSNEAQRKMKIYREAGLPTDMKVESDDGDEWVGERVEIEVDAGPSALDRLAALVGTDE